MLVPKAATVEATTYSPVATQTTPNLPRFAMVPVVALSAPFSDRISHHSIAGGDAVALLKLIGQAHSRAEAALGQPVRVVCCYEAGYDGFWLHRVLSAN